MNARCHPDAKTRPFFRALSGVLALLMLACVPLFIYFGITEGSWFAWLAWLIALNGIFAGLIFAGGAITGEWLGFRRR